MPLRFTLIEPYAYCHAAAGRHTLSCRLRCFDADAAAMPMLRTADAAGALSPTLPRRRTQLLPPTPLPMLIR